MTERRVYELAWGKAIDNWDYWAEILRKQPDNHLAKIRADRAWKEVQELGARLHELEQEV